MESQFSTRDHTETPLGIVGRRVAARKTWRDIEFKHVSPPWRRGSVRADGDPELPPLIHQNRDPDGRSTARPIDSQVEILPIGVVQIYPAISLENLHARAGVPTRLRQIGIPHDDPQNIANETVKNFNVNPGMRPAEDQIQDALRLLETAY